MTVMHIKSLDLNQLRLIEALARTGNLGEAAEEIGFTQSAASHALARLRHELQDAIFVRASRGMRPTPYGAHLAASVREALQALPRAGNRHPVFGPAPTKKTFIVIMGAGGNSLSSQRLLARFPIEAPA